MPKKLTNFLAVSLLSVVPTLLIWLPFAARLKSFWRIPLPGSGMATIVANYDGPLFLAVAKSFYATDILKGFTFNLPVEYFAAHFPLFPLLIKALALPFGFPYSMLIVTMATSILALYFFNLFIRQYVNAQEALWLTAVFSVFPARWLIVRSVGSAEPLFLAGVVGCLYFWQKKHYLWAGICGVVAQLTKSPGIILFLALGGYYFSPTIKNYLAQKHHQTASPLNLKVLAAICLIPLTLVGLFIFYGFRFHDFLAYFHSGDNIHLFFPPFQIFNYSAPWVGTFWIEEVILVYLIGAIGFYKLLEAKETLLAWFVGLFFTSTLFVAHRDLIRYSLPIIPFLFVAFSDLLTTKAFKFAIVVIILPVFLFSLAFISNNAMPIADWGPFL